MCDPDDDWDDPYDPIAPHPGSIEVEFTENPLVAVLYAPDGDVLLEIHERPVVPFGFTL